MTDRFPTLSDIADEISHMPQHIVGLQHVAEGGYVGRWRPLRHNGADDSIEQARKDYDHGFVEMVQGRGVDRMGRTWQIQYAIPRKCQRDRKLNYFCTQGAA